MSASHRNLTLIGASAGSGKTYRLTEEVTRALDPGLPGAIDVEALLAVTYTRKAAAELGGRIRHTLVERNALERAQRLPLAHIGTVHAVCLRLVQEFAIDAGLSPHVDVLSGNEASALREALERGLDPSFRARIQQLADSLQIRFDERRQRADWLLSVQDVMTLARSNRIAPSSLLAMGERSAAGLVNLLGPAEKDGPTLDALLLAALGRAKTALATIRDEQTNTAEARNLIDRVLRDAARGNLPWCEWMRLQKLKPGKTARAAVEPVIAVAARVDGHPRLHRDLRQYVFHVYEAAKLGLESYREWKTSRRVVDYVDMVDRALALVEHPEVAAELHHKLELVVVDEFQDTSPFSWRSSRASTRSPTVRPGWAIANSASSSTPAPIRC